MKDQFHLSHADNLLFARKLLPQSLYSGALMENIPVSYDGVLNILDGMDIQNIPLDYISYILNLRDGWKEMMQTVHEPITVEYLCRINSFVAKNEGKPCGILREDDKEIPRIHRVVPAPNLKDIQTTLNNILSIDCITQRAISFFLYGLYHQLFWECNKQTSFIVANKILIRNGKGMLFLARDQLPTFHNLVTKFYQTGNASPLEYFLFHHCLIGKPPKFPKS